MSTAPLSICVECQLLHCLPALNVNCKEGYLRWASWDMWHSHSSRCQCPGSFQNDTWIREFDWWWVRGSKSPSGSKNLQVDSRTKVGEDTSQSQTSLKLAHPLSKTPIYRSLSMRSRGAGIWYLQRIAIGLWLEILGVLCFERSWRRNSILLGRRCWVGALWVVSLPEPCYFQ